MWRATIMLLLVFYPYAISLPASDLEAGQSYTATISAPAGAAVEVRGPWWITTSPPVYIGGDTYRAELRVIETTGIGKVELWVDGSLRASQGVRVGTPHLIYLPLLQQSRPAEGRLALSKRSGDGTTVAGQETA